MNGLRKFGTPRILEKLPVVSAGSDFGLAKLCAFIDDAHHFSQKARFSATVSASNLRNDGTLRDLARRSRIMRKEAQSALLEYFHSTRGLQFLDAENMSKNAPKFFDALTNRVVVSDDNIGRAVTRFLRYHPVNEFEPFFESIGLKPSEYACYLPRNLMFLNEDQLLLDNYHVLCDYGIPRSRIGKIYKEAMEIFHYEHGVLNSKLQFFKNLELNHSLIIKIIASSPCLLMGKMNQEFTEFLKRLKCIGIEYDWLEKHISLDDLYNWEHMLKLMSFLSDSGFTQDIQKQLLMKHPCLLLELSGHATFSVIGFFLKFGCTLDGMQNTFLRFPKISVMKFAGNLRSCYKFLDEIGMAILDVGSLVHSHPTMLGSCEMKTVNSLLGLLNCGKDRACQMVKEDPEVLKKWALYVKVQPIQKVKRTVRVRAMKTDFLLSLGFQEESKEIEKILKRLRGKGLEIRERFDCLTNMGFSREQAIQVVKSSPQVLNQSKELIETKINFFVEELGLLVTDILTHPRLISYTVERVKLRVLMHKWLKEKRFIDASLRLSTVLASSETRFLSRHVNPYPGALAQWETLKREVYPCTSL